MLYASSHFLWIWKEFLHIDETENIVKTLNDKEQFSALTKMNIYYCEKVNYKEVLQKIL